MSELCMRRTEAPLEITGGPTILRKKKWMKWLWLKKINKSQKKNLQINKTLRKNKWKQESKKQKEKEDLKNTG